MEDRLLVFQCKRGSREALTRIYEKYRTDLLLLAMGLLNDKAAAEDIVHDVFLSFVRHLGGFRLTGSLKGFLLTCTANHARNWNKAQRVRLRASDPNASPATADVSRPSWPRCAEGIPSASSGQALPSDRGRDARDTSEGPLETLVCNEQLAMLGEALAELPFEQREVVMLHLHGQMTFQAIANAGQISTNTAKSRYRYGMDKLRSILNGRISKCDQQMT